MADRSIDLMLQFQRLTPNSVKGLADETAPDACHVYAVTLIDFSSPGTEKESDGFRIHLNHKIPGTDLTPLEFERRFASANQRNSLSHEDALCFGVWLQNKLFSLDAPAATGAARHITKLWEYARYKKSSLACGIRIQFSLPKVDPGILERLPLELLAISTPSREFMGRKPGWEILRGTPDNRITRVFLSKKTRLGGIWAISNRASVHESIPDAMQKQREIIDQAAETLQCRSLEPIQIGSRTALLSLPKANRVSVPAVLSLVVSPVAGGLVLADTSKEDPTQGKELVTVKELAKSLKRFGAWGVLLSHDAAPNDVPISMELSKVLLKKVAASFVIGSHVELGLDAQLEFANRVFRELPGAHQGSLSSAVAAVRRTYSENDLQWAAFQCSTNYRFNSSTDLARFRKLPQLSKESWSARCAPLVSPHFVGRDEVLGRLAVRLQSKRLVTLTGLPGIGKSEVAIGLLKLLSQSVKGELDNAVWVRLSEVRTLANLRSQLYTLFDFEQIGDDFEFAKSIRDHRTLIVLDNADTLISSARNELHDFLGIILKEASHVRLLVTSQVTLGDIGGVTEHVERIGRLAPPFDRTMFHSVAGEKLSQVDQESIELHQLIDSLSGHPQC